MAQEDLDKVTGWLESHGFRVNQVYTNRILIDFSGTAGQIKDAFHTSIHQLDVKGQMHFANMGDPRIPAALAPVVKGIVSLNDFTARSHARAVRRALYSRRLLDRHSADSSRHLLRHHAAGRCGIYNTNPLWSQGITGAGQTIAVIEDTDTYNGTGDWSTYISTFGLSGYGGTYTQVHPGGCTDPGINGRRRRSGPRRRNGVNDRARRWPSKTSLARRARSPSAARLPCKT